MSAPAPCPNCGTEAIGAYCHACGQQIDVDHSLFGVVFKSAYDIGQLDHVLARTLVDLLRRPGALIGDVLRGKTKPYAKPVATLLLVASAVFLLMRWTGLADAMGELQSEQAKAMGGELMAKVQEFVLAWGAYVNLAALPFAAFASWLLDGRRHIYSHWLVFHAYAAAGTSLISLLTMPWFIGHPRVYAYVMLWQFPVMAAYIAWCARGAFRHSWLRAIAAVGVPTLIVSGFVSAAVSLAYMVVVIVRSGLK